MQRALKKLCFVIWFFKKKNKEKTCKYHALDVKNCCTGVNVSLSSDATSWELDGNSFLKLSNMISQVSLQRSDLHEFACVHSSQSFNVNRSSLFVNTMISLRVVIQNLIQFWKLKFLTSEEKEKPSQQYYKNRL